MSAWRWAAIVPLTLVVMVSAVVVALVLAVSVPFSIAFHMLNAEEGNR